MTLPKFLSVQDDCHLLLHVYLGVTIWWGFVTEIRRLFRFDDSLEATALNLNWQKIIHLPFGVDASRRNLRFSRFLFLAIPLCGIQINAVWSKGCASGDCRQNCLESLKCLMYGMFFIVCIPFDSVLHLLLVSEKEVKLVWRDELIVSRSNDWISLNDVDSRRGVFPSQRA